MKDLANKLLDIVQDNPIFGILFLVFVSYVVVEVTAIIFLHHTVNLNF